MISEILNPEKHSLYMYYKVNTNYSKYTEDSRVHSFIIHLFICSFVHSFRKKRQSNSYNTPSKTFVGYKISRKHLPGTDQYDPCTTTVELHDELPSFFMYMLKILQLIIN